MSRPPGAAAADGTVASNVDNSAAANTEHQSIDIEEPAVERIVGGGLRRAAGPVKVVVGDKAVALRRQPSRHSKPAELSGARRFVASGVSCLMGSREPTGASMMLLRPLFVSVNMPLIPVTSRAWGYFASVDAP